MSKSLLIMGILILIFISVFLALVINYGRLREQVINYGHQIGTQEGFEEGRIKGCFKAEKEAFLKGYNEGFQEELGNNIALEVDGEFIRQTISQIYYITPWDAIKELESRGIHASLLYVMSDKETSRYDKIFFGFNLFNGNTFFFDSSSHEEADIKLGEPIVSPVTYKGYYNDKPVDEILIIR